MLIHVKDCDKDASTTLLLWISSQPQLLDFFNQKSKVLTPNKLAELIRNRISEELPQVDYKSQSLSECLGFFYAMDIDYQEVALQFYQ